MTENNEAGLRLNVKELIVDSEERILDEDPALESEAEDEAFKQLSAIDPVALMAFDDVHQIQNCLRLDSMSASDPLLRAMGVTYFYRKNYEVADAMLGKCGILQQNDLDLPLMRAECEIMMASGVEICQNTFVDMVKGSKELTENHIEQWDNLLVQAHRHVGRILLQLAVCERYVSRNAKRVSVLTLYLYFMNMVTRYEDLLQSEIADEALDSIEILAQVLVFMSRPGVVCGIRDSRPAGYHIAFIQALCYNILACRCIRAGKDKTAEKYAWAGRWILQRAVPPCINVLRGNLLENQAIACYNRAVNALESGEMRILILTVKNLCNSAITAYDSTYNLGKSQITLLKARVDRLMSKAGAALKCVLYIN